MKAYDITISDSLQGHSLKEIQTIFWEELLKLDGGKLFENDYFIYLVTKQGKKIVVDKFKIDSENDSRIVYRGFMKEICDRPVLFNKMIDISLCELVDGIFPDDGGFRILLEGIEDVEKNHTIEILANKALDEIHGKHFALSIATSKEALSINPFSSEAHFNLGYALREENCFEDSLNSFNKALEISPKHIASLYQSSYSFSALGQFTKQLECINKIIELEPNGDLYSVRSFIKEKLGDFEGAENDKIKSLEFPHDFNVF